MRALEPDVFDAVWAAVEPLLPAPTRPIRSDAIVADTRQNLLPGDAPAAGDGCSWWMPNSWSTRGLQYNVAVQADEWGGQGLRSPG